jgi:hypothetical protein
LEVFVMGHSPEELERVLQALNNERFKWRTLKGIVRESGLEPDTVMTVIRCNENLIAQSSVLSSKGDELFTSRSNLSSSDNTMTRLLGAFKGRAS